MQFLDLFSNTFRSHLNINAVLQYEFYIVGEGGVNDRYNIVIVPNSKL